jgi:hypothetical protein
MDSARSTFAREPWPKSITIRIESHAKGEVFTLDRIEADGRDAISSSLLYLDGKPRDFEEGGCLGTEASRHTDSQTVEILRTCGNRRSIRFVRRFSPERNELILDITEEQDGGTRIGRHLVFGKRR